MQETVPMWGLAAAFFGGPFALLLGGIVYLAIEKSLVKPKAKRPRLVCVYSRIKSETQPIVYAGENRRVRVQH